MSLLAEIVIFFLGVYLMIEMLAALYGIIDLWYMMGKAWPRVLRGILGWGITIAVTAWLLGPQRSALAAGMIVYLLFYVSLFPLVRLFLRAIQRKS